MSSPDRFPVMGVRGARNGTIPWSCLLPNRSRVMRNHGQSLTTLARRGGLAPCELVAILEDKPWSYCQGISEEVAEAKLIRLCPGWIRPEDEEEHKRRVNSGLGVFNPEGTVTGRVPARKPPEERTT